MPTLSELPTIASASFRIGWTWIRIGFDVKHRTVMALWVAGPRPASTNAFGLATRRQRLLIEALVYDAEASTWPAPSVTTARRFGSKAIVKLVVEQARVTVRIEGGAAAKAVVPIAAAAASKTATRAISPDGTPGRIVRP